MVGGKKDGAVVYFKRKSDEAEEIKGERLVSLAVDTFGK